MKKGEKVTSGDRKRHGRFTETCKPDEPEAYFCYGHFADSTQHRVYAVFKCVFIGFAGISGRKYDSTGYGAAVARIASCPALYRNRCSNVFEYADSIFFSAKYGRNRGTRAKLIAGLVVVTAIYWIIIVLYSVIVLGWLGLDGGNVLITQTSHINFSYAP